VLFNLVDTVAKSEEVTRHEQNNSINICIVKDGYRVYLAKNKVSNAWIVTGFEDHESNSDGSGQDAPPPTLSESTLTRNGAGAANNNLSNPIEKSFKYSRTPATGVLADAMRKAGFGPKKTLSESIQGILNQGFNGNVQAFKDTLSEKSRSWNRAYSTNS
jgi:hypothetical protein